MICAVQKVPYPAPTPRRTESVKHPAFTPGLHIVPMLTTQAPGRANAWRARRRGKACPAWRNGAALRAGGHPGNALGSGLVPAQQPTRPIGAHVRVTGGLAVGGLRYAAETGAEAIQVFASNPRGWALSAGDARQDAALRDHVARTGLPVFVHATYLINLGSPDPVTRQRSAASLAHSLRRGRDIGALGVVVHTGSAVRAGREQGMRHVRECLLPLL